MHHVIARRLALAVGVGLIVMVGLFAWLRASGG